MPYIKLPDGTEIGVSLEDIILAIKMLFRNNTLCLTYDADRIISFYAKNSKWLAVTLPAGELRVPYINEVDFRSFVPPKHWGTVSCVEPFEFPHELQAHRAKMVAKFEAEKRLKKGNRPCPRVRSFSQTESSEFHLEVQKAWYFDQVGTNLTLDYPFEQAMIINGAEVRTVRDWDLLNGGRPMLAPPLSSSRLANTIGVAVGVTANDQFGRRQIVKRLRSSEVAVYENQWHVPLSFALAWPEGFDPGETMTLSELIGRDFGHELAEELPGFEPTDFTPPRLLAFCRDMVRGGKPQFFLEVQSRLSLNEIQDRMPSDYAEFTSQTGVMDRLEPKLSPELLAFSILVGMPSSA